MSWPRVTHLESASTPPVNGMPSSQQRAERYRKRALEILAAAEEMKSAESRRTLQKLARDYDLLADRIDEIAEETAGRHKKRRPT